MELNGLSTVRICSFKNKTDNEISLTSVTLSTFAAAQCKLREGSVALGVEMLRCGSA
jgi:hypothetical protein